MRGATHFAWAELPGTSAWATRGACSEIMTTPIESAIEPAPAKVNLTLIIRGRRPDGYHELESLVAFAAAPAADKVTLETGHPFRLDVEGPEAAGLSAGPDGENLISRIVRAAAAADPSLRLGRFRLTKVLPVASGIGGGSADAAAALRLLARWNAIADPERAFSALAALIGADIPVCIGGRDEGAPYQRAAYMWGIGQHVWRPPQGSLLPAAGLPAVLANPRIAVATGAVFRALAAPAISSGGAPARPEPLRDVAAVYAYLDQRPNDLEAPAVTLAPQIACVLAALRGLPGARLARMSGSGATCFALFDDWPQAEAAAARLHADQPSWWIAATMLR